MSTTPSRPDPGEREDSARLLPAPVERDLPGDRHRLLKEFVMNEIQRDRRPAGRAARRVITGRRLLLGAGVVTAAAAAAVAVPAMTGSETPAYAMTSHADGSITVKINRFRNPGRLEADLARHGVRADITYLAPGEHCAGGGSPDRGRGGAATSARTEPDAGEKAEAGAGRPHGRAVVLGEGNRITIIPTRVGEGRTLVLRFQEQKNGAATLDSFVGSGPVTPCSPVEGARPRPTGDAVPAKPAH